MLGTVSRIPASPRRFGFDAAGLYAEPLIAETPSPSAALGRELSMTLAFQC